MDPKLESRYVNPDKSPGYQLWRVTNQWQRHIRLALKPFGITHVQFVLLAVTAKLLESHETTNQIQIAKAANTDPMMTSQVLRALEEKSLVVRSANPEDARSIHVSLTPSGLELINQAISAVEDADDHFFGLLRGEVDTLARLLHRLVEE